MSFDLRRASRRFASDSLDRRDLMRLSAAGALATMPAGFAGARRAAAQDTVSMELDFLTPESVISGPAVVLPCYTPHPR